MGMTMTQKILAASLCLPQGGRGTAAAVDEESGLCRCLRV